MTSGFQGKSLQQKKYIIRPTTHKKTNLLGVDKYEQRQTKIKRLQAQKTV